MIIVTPYGIYTFDNLMDASALCLDLMDADSQAPSRLARDSFLL